MVQTPYRLYIEADSTRPGPRFRLLNWRNNVYSPYAEWINQPVLLQVKVGDFRTTLRGAILGESNDSLQFRFWKGHQNLQILKSTVLAVEQFQERSRKAQSDINWPVRLAS